MNQPEKRGHVVPYLDQQSHRAVPKELAWVGIGLVILVAFHIIVTAIMVLQRAAIAEGIKAANPTLTELQLSYALTVTLVASALFHGIFVLLYIWLAFKLRTGKKWVRVVLTVVLAVATVASAVSFTSSPMFRLVIPLGDLLQVALIGLLWFPASSRAYFATKVSPGGRGSR